MSTPEALVARQFAAYAARDLEAFVSTYAEDAVVSRLGEDVPLAVGHEQMRQVYGRLFAENPGLRCVLVSRFVKGDIVIDRERISGLAGRPDFEGVVLYKVRDGLIARSWVV